MDDPLSGPLKILSSFARIFLPELEPFYRGWDAEKILQEEKVRRQLGFDLLLQVTRAAYTQLLNDRGFDKEVKPSYLTFAGDATTLSVDITKDESYVPETMDFFESSPVIESTCTILPETNDWSFANADEPQVDAVCTPDTRKNPLQRKKSPVSSSTKSREVSDKYSPLACIQSESNNETTTSLGALGTGPNPTKAPKKAHTLVSSDGGSPSLLQPVTSRIIEAGALTEYEDENQSDFQDCSSFKKLKDGSSHAKKRKHKKQKTDEDVLTNRFGINVIEASSSEKKRMSTLKQQSISKYAVSASAPDLPKKRVDTELELAMAQSLETSKQIEEKKKKKLRSPLKNLLLDGSLDLLPGDKKRGPDFKYVESPVRRWNDRKLLPAYGCIECRDYYTGSNLTKEELRILIQNCSKHRSLNPPMASSPQHCWNLDLRPDCTQDITQTPKPLRTRKRKVHFSVTVPE